jgi:hypothetical protein
MFLILKRQMTYQNYAKNINMTKCQVKKKRDKPSFHNSCKFKLKHRVINLVGSNDC